MVDRHRIQADDEAQAAQQEQAGEGYDERRDRAEVSDRVRPRKLETVRVAGMILFSILYDLYALFSRKAVRHGFFSRGTTL